MLNISNIIKTGSIPEIDEEFRFWSQVGYTFGPKFYYFFSAEIIKNLNITEKRWITAANLINVFTSIIMLFYIFKFINKIKLKNSTKLIIFSLVALNPGLIRINIQTG